MALPVGLAMPFGLVLHELATNATKYGALSRPGGTVLLRWTADAGNDREMLAFTWEEHGGPPVQQPAKAGLGSALIESAIPAAQVACEFRSEGLICRIQVPIRETADGGDGAKH